VNAPSHWHVYIVVFDVSGSEPHTHDEEQIAGPYTKAHRLDAYGRRVGPADLVIDEYCPDMLVARLLDGLRFGTVKSV
jgi:hypothetical protein